MAKIDPNESPSMGAAPPAVALLFVPGSVFAGCALAWLGILDCLLLLQRHAAIRDFLCPARNGCDAVLASPFAAVGGVPLSLVGAGYYSGILAIYLTVLGFTSKTVRLRLLEGVLWLLVVGLTFSVGLMYLQFGVLRAFCPLCTASALITCALLPVTLRARRALAGRVWGSSREMAVTLGWFALFPALILLVSGFAPPIAPLQTLRIDLTTAQISGPREAPAQLVVFSDYECSFCRQLAPILRRIRTEFPEKVMVAFLDYPLENHSRAFAAAVAAHCAGEQGAFWPYHDRLFAEGGDLGDAVLLKLADSLNLDRGQFAECLKSEKATELVRASQAEAIASGLEGVPAVFLNGRRVEGGLSYGNLVRRIREVIEASERNPAAPGR